MWKGKLLVVLFILFSAPVWAAGYIPKQFANTNTGDGLYPYSLNNKKQLPQTKNYTPPIGAGVTPMQQSGKRGVTKRPVRARAATAKQTQNNYSGQPRRVVQRPNVARSAANTNYTPRNTNHTIDNRRVVARGAAIPVQTRSKTVKRVTTSSNSNTSAISSQQCFAKYKDCMESYCKREDTAYNRCYCSAKLAQIDSKYQGEIDSLVQQIVELQNKPTISDSDEPLTSVETYWRETVEKYTGTNSWDNIDTNIQIALDNIDWADNATRVRGQNAFNTGHQYCVNYLTACSHMATNLRDAYKSEITRDCATYEESLKRLKTIAESVVEQYSK